MVEQSRRIPASGRQDDGTASSMTIPLIELLDRNDLIVGAHRFFPSSYRESRRGFCEKLDTARVYTLPDLTGPDGEELAIDTGWIGAEDADRVLVIISGTHGPEGYCGAGIQTDWLSLLEMSAGLPENLAILFIHGLNPHGFAWDRRVTQEGCDLNRNFVDFAVGVPENAGYEELRHDLIPPRLDGPEYEKAQQAIREFRRTRGERAFQIARKAGQYVDPNGMFFGGFAPSWSATMLDAIARDYRLAERRFVAVMDVHTGLGPYGYGELQSEHVADSQSHTIAEWMFGASVTSADIGTSSSIPIEGTMQLYWERLLGDGRYIYLALEFGTFNIDAAQRVLLSDQWFHLYGGGDRTSPAGRKLRAQMRAHFTPQDLSWRESVLFRGRQVLRQALKGLVGEIWLYP